MIYVANTGDGTVSVIDPATDTVVTTVIVGNGASAIAVNAVTNKIYVANYADDTVSVIDGATGAVDATVAVGDGPGSIAVNAVTNKIYVANCNEETVTVIDGSTNAPTTIVTTGGYPYSIKVNAVTNKVYACDWWSEVVIVIDGATGLLSTLIPAASGAWPVAVDIDETTNKVYVTDAGHDNVIVIDGTTDTITTTVAAGDECWDIVVNPITAKICVGNTRSDNVTVIDGATNTVDATAAAGDYPRALAVNRTTNKVYCVNLFGGTTTVIDGATNGVDATVTVGMTPCAAAVLAASNKVYVVNHDSDNVTVIDGATNTVLTTIAVGDGPEAICFILSTPTPPIPPTPGDPSIVFLPEMSETFGRMKEYLDKYVYNTRPSAFFKLNDITVSGCGFVSGDTVEIRYHVGSSDDTVIYVTAIDGTFLYALSNLSFDETNFIEVYDSNDVYLGGTAIDEYYYLAVVYLLSLEFIRLWSEFAIGKQDVYIDPTLIAGSVTAQDAFTTDVLPQSNLWTDAVIVKSLKRYLNEKAVYSSSRTSLKDKMTLPIPSDVWMRSGEDAVKRAILISEKGPVLSILNLLQEIYSVVGVSKIFTYPVESSFVVGAASTADCTPRVTSFGAKTVTIPAGSYMRYDWRVLPISAAYPVIVDFAAELDAMVEGGPDKYVWAYVDGEIDVNNTLVIKTSEVQPTPVIGNVVTQYFTGDVEYDDEDGTITEVPFQAYLNLEIPAYTVLSSVIVSGATTTNIYEAAKLIKRDVLGLGVGNVSESLFVGYDQLIFNRHLFCAHLSYPSGATDASIIALHRNWNQPGHVRGVSIESLAGVQIFIDFSSVPSNYLDVLKSLAIILREIVPVVSEYIPFVNLALNDQIVYSEDGVMWPMQFKNFQFLGRLVDIAEIAPQEGNK